MIGMLEIEFGVYACLSRRIEEIHDKWKWIPVFLSDPVESPVIPSFFLAKRIGAP
jgi:hypothetical protein